MSLTESGSASEWIWCEGWLQQPAGARTQRSVIKLGGSLLTLPGWPAAIRRLIAKEHASSRPLLVVVGGGPLVEGLRQLDATSPQPAERMHHLAIEAMSLTAQLAAATLDLPLSTTLDPRQPAVLNLARSPDGMTAIAALPQSWSVTSDSIAAAVAGSTAAELLLVKRAAPTASSISELASSGWVDRSFEAACRQVAGLRWTALAGSSR